MRFVHQDYELPLQYRRAEFELSNSLPSRETEHSFTAVDSELIHGEVNGGRRQIS